MIKRRIWGAVAVTAVAFSHHGAGRMPMQGDRELAQFFVFRELRFTEALDSCFDAFSSRQPVATPDQSGAAFARKRSREKKRAARLGDPAALFPSDGGGRIPSKGSWRERVLDP